MNGLHTVASDVGVSPRTLRRAVAQGTLRGTRRRNAVALPLSERQYVRRSWNLISAINGALRTEHNVRLAILFGSTATGQDVIGSDVDLLVSMRDDDLERVADLEGKLEVILGRRVDVVRAEDAERDPSFLGEAIDRGRVLVDRDGQLPRLSHSRRREASDRAIEIEAALAGIDRLIGRSREDR